MTTKVCNCDLLGLCEWIFCTSPRNFMKISFHFSVDSTRYFLLKIDLKSESKSQVQQKDSSPLCTSPAHLWNYWIKLHCFLFLDQLGDEDIFSTFSITLHKRGGFNWPEMTKNENQLIHYFEHKMCFDGSDHNFQLFFQLPFFHGNFLTKRWWFWRFSGISSVQIGA